MARNDCAYPAESWFFDRSRSLAHTYWWITAKAGNPVSYVFEEVERILGEAIVSTNPGIWDINYSLLWRRFLRDWEFMMPKNLSIP